MGLARKSEMENSLKGGKQVGERKLMCWVPMLVWWYIGSHGYMLGNEEGYLKTFQCGLFQPNNSFI
jgi:hypothetical protein